MVIKGIEMPDGDCQAQDLTAPVEQGMCWTPVSDRTPPKYTEVLVTTDDGKVRSDYTTKNGDWFGEIMQPGYRVLAWMPIPKPFC